MYCVLSLANEKYVNKQFLSLGSCFLTQSQHQAPTALWYHQSHLSLPALNSHSDSDWEDGAWWLRNWSRKWEVWPRTLELRRTWIPDQARAAATPVTMGWLNRTSTQAQVTASSQCWMQFSITSHLFFCHNTALCLNIVFLVPKGYHAPSQQADLAEAQGWWITSRNMADYSLSRQFILIKPLWVSSSWQNSIWADSDAFMYFISFLSYFDKLHSRFRQHLGFTGIKINYFYHVPSQFWKIFSLIKMNSWRYILYSIILSLNM